MDAALNFIQLDPAAVAFLFIVGFVGGMVSGFIGSGGAFVLTPAMMSMGVPGIVAVASNMCHKFPKALVGAIKRAKYGQVDLKLGLFMGASAEAGVLTGAHVQQIIKSAFGEAGSNLYVSAAFVVVLAIVGGFVMRDAIRTYRSGTHHEEEKAGKLALWIQSIHIPGTMVYFKSINARVSWLITVPLGFATGMLAATIAVGGFVGVPSMMYVLGVPGMMASATELVIAFVMGLGGTIKFAWSGFVDIRLAMIILAGSLFGIQLGAIGTTYVKPFMIKVVMATIMLTVLFSRAFVIPVYLSELGMIDPLSETSIAILKNISFGVMILALVVGAGMVLWALARGMKAHRQAGEEVVVAQAQTNAVSVNEEAVMETGKEMTLCRRMLCVIEPNAQGRQLLWRLASQVGSEGARLAVISVVPFTMPIEASASVRPTPLDTRARLIHERQRQVDALVRELHLKDVEIYVTAGQTRKEVLDLARQWQADVVVAPRGLGLRSRDGGGRHETRLVDSRGNVVQPGWLDRVLGAKPAA